MIGNSIKAWQNLVPGSENYNVETLILDSIKNLDGSVFEGCLTDGAPTGSLLAQGSVLQNHAQIFQLIETAEARQPGSGLKQTVICLPRFSPSTAALDFSARLKILAVYLVAYPTTSMSYLNLTEAFFTSSLSVKTRDQVTLPELQVDLGFPLANATASPTGNTACAHRVFSKGDVYVNFNEPASGVSCGVQQAPSSQLVDLQATSGDPRGSLVLRQNMGAHLLPAGGSEIWLRN